MQSTLEKQKALLKSTIFLPLVMLGIALVVFFAVSIGNYPMDGEGLGTWLAIQIPTVLLLSGVYVALYIPHIKAYKALKALPPNPPLREMSFHCVKVKCLHDGNKRINGRRFCGVIFIDKDGNKYTYILEQTLWKDKENYAPYLAKKDTTVVVLCYADTHYIAQIKG